jgi:hypothetical protein
LLRFEREGGELEYQVEEKGYAQFLCKIELPVDTPTGESSVVEALVKGKKYNKLLLGYCVAKGSGPQTMGGSATVFCKIKFGLGRCALLVQRLIFFGARL